MRIAIVGLGYVGTVNAVCLASAGHDITGIDIDRSVLSALRSGRSPIMEPRVPELLARALEERRLTVTDRADDGLRGADIAMICVGTPPTETGAVDLRALEAAVATVGRTLATHDKPVEVVIRSTVPPGTTRNTVIPLLEAEGRTDARAAVIFNPEFMRAGSAIEDYFAAPRTVIGVSTGEGSNSRIYAVYRGLGIRVKCVSWEIAELIKYADNSFHALKVAFANEMATLARGFNVDSAELMALFVEDRKLNISPAYLRPGFAFGGTCLPKDVAALSHAAVEMDAELPLINAILPSNRAHFSRAVALIESQERGRVLVVGFQFKPNSDDLRKSPTIELVNALLDDGFDVRVVEILDPRELEQLKTKWRHHTGIARALDRVTGPDEESKGDGGCIVLASRSPAALRYAEQLIDQHRVVVDLEGVMRGCWGNQPWYRSLV
jgi:GDP-mannose 6-dehydrogenase